MKKPGNNVELGLNLPEAELSESQILDLIDRLQSELIRTSSYESKNLLLCIIYRLSDSGSHASEVKVSKNFEIYNGKTTEELISDFLKHLKSEVRSEEFAKLLQLIRAQQKKVREHIISKSYETNGSRFKKVVSILNESFRKNSFNFEVAEVAQQHLPPKFVVSRNGKPVAEIRFDIVNNKDQDNLVLAFDDLEKEGAPTVIYSKNLNNPEEADIENFAEMVLRASASEAGQRVISATTGE